MKYEVGFKGEVKSKRGTYEFTIQGKYHVRATSSTCAREKVLERLKDSAEPDKSSFVIQYICQRD